MFLEIVKFGNGVAIEVRDTPTKITVLYTITCATELNTELPDVPANPLEMDIFENQCLKVIDAAVDKKLRWLMLCTDVEILTESSSKDFEEAYFKAFNIVPSLNNSGEKSLGQLRAKVLIEGGIGIKQRVWMFDRESLRVFCVQFQFAAPIYNTTLLAGVMLKHKTFQAQYRGEELKQKKGVCLDDEETTEAEQMLQRLKELMPKEIDETTTTGVLESREVDVTEFIVKDAKMWCGDSCFKCVWLAQQLNVWFNTPTSEQFWFRPSEKDPFSFTVGIWNELTSPNTTHDVERWLALPAPSTQNTMWRYPHGNIMCVTPKGMLGIGHFLPQFNENMERWTNMFNDREVRLFRLYKTQYPFVYSLMPNDDKQVRMLKSKLKHSTDSNPGLAERGKEDVKGRLKSSTERGPVAKFTPLIATIPTLELERYVKAVFQGRPKHRYTVWWCARYEDAQSKAIWIPITPSEK